MINGCSICYNRFTAGLPILLEPVSFYLIFLLYKLLAAVLLITRFYGHDPRVGNSMKVIEWTPLFFNNNEWYCIFICMQLIRDRKWFQKINYRCVIMCETIYWYLLLQIFFIGLISFIVSAGIPLWKLKNQAEIKFVYVIYHITAFCKPCVPPSIWFYFVML